MFCFQLWFASPCAFPPLSRLMSILAYPIARGHFGSAAVLAGMKREKPEEERDPRDLSEEEPDSEGSDPRPYTPPSHLPEHCRDGRRLLRRGVVRLLRRRARVTRLARLVCAAWLKAVRLHGGDVEQARELWLRASDQYVVDVGAVQALSRPD